MHKNSIEILAPAGSEAAFYAAINNGADAVYLGIGTFNARAKADNFNLEQLKIAIKHAHLFGVRVFVAFNTLLKDDEIPKAVGVIKEAASLGVDAIILQDLGLLLALQNAGIKTEFHASTQMGIHNLEGALVAQKLGFKRVILSRETLLQDIKLIKQNTNLELEFFVHGALCVAFSGNCYFSSAIMGQSGNRGRCNQLCRKPYFLKQDGTSSVAIKNKKPTDYLLSPRDLFLADNLKELIDAGITSFKIEGRLRRAEYVGETVKVYKKAVLNLQKGKKDLVCKLDKNNLKTLFNRGDYCSGYLGFNKTPIIDKNHPAHIGLNIGTVSAVNKGATSSNATLSLKLDSGINLTKGDGLKFMRENREVGTSLVDNINAITFVGEVKKGDTVRLTSSVKLNNEILERKKVIELTGSAKIQAGSKAKFSITDGNVVVETESLNTVQKAIGAPLVAEKLDFLAKTTDNSLVMRDIVCDLGENCFMSVGELKQLRNEVIEKFKQERINLHRGIVGDIENDSNLSIGISDNNQLLVENLLKQQNLMQLDKKSVFVMVDELPKITDKLITSSDFVVLNPSEYNYNTIHDFCIRVGKKAIVNLPILNRGRDLHVMRDITSKLSQNLSKIQLPAFIVNNISGLELVKNHKIILGHGLNFLNSEVFKLLQNTQASNKFLPIIASLESIAPKKYAINYIYGSLPLMMLATCPINANSPNICKQECHDGKSIKKQHSLVDAGNNEFKLRQIKIANCYTEILNSIVLDNREVLGYDDCSVLIDLTTEVNADAKLEEILTVPHSNLPHTHGNYNKKLF